MITSTISDMLAAQQAIQQIYRAVQPAGALGAAVGGAGESLYKGVWNRTPQATGTLAAAERVVWAGPLTTAIYTSDQRNPRGGQTSVYGPLVEARDGMYADTFADDLPDAAQAAVDAIIEALP